MEKVYCKDCYWMRAYKNMWQGYHSECSQTKCFKGGEKEKDTPLCREKIDTTRRVAGIDDLNHDNACPDFRQITPWERFKRHFDIRIEPR